MSKFKKRILVTGIAVMIIAGIVAPGGAQAITAAELQVQITALLAQITALQAQLAAVDGGTTTPGTITGIPSGYTWTANLTVGSRGAGVKYLQILLNSDSATKLADSGAGSPGNETEYFGPITKAAVVKFHEKYASDILTPLGLTAGTGFFGPSSRTKANSVLGSAVVVTPPADGTTPPVVTPPVVEGDLTVAFLGPVSSTLVAEQATATLLDLTFVGSATVTGIVLERIGVSGNTTPSNVYLFDGATRLTDAGTVNSAGIVTFNSINGLFIVNGIKTISVKSDILTGTAGQSLGMQLTAVTLASGTVSGLPIVGNLHGIATATLAAVTLGGITPTTSSIDAANDVIVWESTAIVATRQVSLTRLALRNIGSINSSDVVNFRLLVSGVEVAQTQNLDLNGYVTFDLSVSPHAMNTGNRILRVMADVIGGASRNLQMSLRRAADIGLVDSSYDVNISASDDYPAGTGVIGINAGTMTVVKASDSPSGNITDAAIDAVLARYLFTAFGEPIKVETLNATFDSSDDSVTQLRSGRIMVNGAQVGSTAALVEIDTTPAGTQYTTNFIVTPGTPVTVEIRADIYDDDGVVQDVGTGDTFTARLVLGISNGVPQTSLGTIAVPSAAQVGNQVIVAGGSSSLVKTLSYPNQTFTVPRSAYKIAEWDLTNGSTEAVNITTLDADFAVGDLLLIGSLSDVYVKYGSNVSTVKSSVILTPNVWSVNFQLAKNESMKVQVFANIATFVVLGSDDNVTATMEVSGTGVDSAGAVTTNAIPGQTMTAGTGTLLAAADATTPDSALLDDSGTARVAAFEFITTNDAFTITSINVNLSSATTVTSVLLKDGGTTVQTQPGALDVTFAGLSIPVVANSAKVLKIDLVMASVGTGAGTSASNVAVTLDSVTSNDSQGVEYIDLSPETSQGDLDDNGAGADPAGNATYIYKAVPTITLVNLPSGILGTGTKTLAKFTIDTGGSGTIAWRKLLFTVTKTIAAGDGVISSPTLWNASTNIEVTGTGIATTLAGGDSSGTITFLATNEQQIAGAKTYELRANVAGVIVVATDSVNTSIANPITAFTGSTAAYASNATDLYYDIGDTGAVVAGDVRQGTVDKFVGTAGAVAGTVTVMPSAFTLTKFSTGSVAISDITMVKTDAVWTATSTSAETWAVTAGNDTTWPTSVLASTGENIAFTDGTATAGTGTGVVTMTETANGFLANSVVATDSDVGLVITAGVDATASFLWSDRSAPSHSITTTDWTRDYLVKSLPTVTQNLE